MLVRVKVSSFCNFNHITCLCFFEVSQLHHSNFCLYTMQVIAVDGNALRRGTDGGMAYTRFKAHKFSFLNIINIASDYVLKDSECGLACVNIPSGFSFNLAPFSDVMSEKILCELLASDIYNKSKEFLASQFHYHYSIAVSEKSTLKNQTFLYFSFFSFFTVLKSCEVVQIAVTIVEKEEKEENKNVLKTNGIF